jgi:hypothetical protein
MKILGFRNQIIHIIVDSPVYAIEGTGKFSHKIEVRTILRSILKVFFFNGPEKIRINKRVSQGSHKLERHVWESRLYLFLHCCQCETRGLAIMTVVFCLFATN